MSILNYLQELQQSCINVEDQATEILATSMESCDRSQLVYLLEKVSIVF